MTVNLALEYIPRRMQELGYRADYYIRFRHFVLQPSEELILQQARDRSSLRKAIFPPSLTRRSMQRWWPSPNPRQ